MHSSEISAPTVGWTFLASWVADGTANKDEYKRTSSLSRTYSSRLILQGCSNLTHHGWSKRISPLRRTYSLKLIQGCTSPTLHLTYLGWLSRQAHSPLRRTYPSRVIVEARRTTSAGVEPIVYRSLVLFPWVQETQQVGRTRRMDYCSGGQHI